MGSIFRCGSIERLQFKIEWCLRVSYSMSQEYKMDVVKRRVTRNCLRPQDQTGTGKLWNGIYYESNHDNFFNEV